MGVPVGVSELVGVCVCESDGVVVLESETLGVCDALAADEREEVGDSEIVVDPLVVDDGVCGGVRVDVPVGVDDGVPVDDSDGVVDGVPELDGVPDTLTPRVTEAVGVAVSVLLRLFVEDGVMEDVGVAVEVAVGVLEGDTSRDGDAVPVGDAEQSKALELMYEGRPPALPVPKEIVDEELVRTAAEDGL